MLIHGERLISVLKAVAQARVMEIERFSTNPRDPAEGEAERSDGIPDADELDGNPPRVLKQPRLLEVEVGLATIVPQELEFVDRSRFGSAAVSLGA